MSFLLFLLRIEKALHSLEGFEVAAEKNEKREKSFVNNKGVARSVLGAFIKPGIL